MKDVWANAFEEQAFRGDTCRLCYQVDEAIKRTTGAGEGCPHLLRASQNKLPTAWTKRRGNEAVLGKTYRCSDKTAKPAVVRRKTSPADTVPMFEPEPVDRNLVPVDGWPSAEDFGINTTSKDGDHQ
jgi:hypothetical protein